MNRPHLPSSEKPPNQDSPNGDPEESNGVPEETNGVPAENCTDDSAGITVDPDSADAMLGELKREMNRLQREIRLAIQAQLGRMSGRSLGSLEANRNLARSIQEMLDTHGLRVRCNQCGHPAILRVSPRAGASAGVFVFDHTIDGRRTFHGGRISMPEIRLVSKPARKPPTKKSDDDGKIDKNRAAG